MLTLFHYPLCPHSRFVRLALEELGAPPRLVEERIWERREEFLRLNPAATTPVLVEEGVPPIPALPSSPSISMRRAGMRPQHVFCPRSRRIALRSGG